MKGSDFWRDLVPDNLGAGYVQSILHAIRNGDSVIEWKTITAGDLEFEIMRAPFAVGNFDDHVFCLGLSAEAVDLIALELGDVMSPTPRLWDLAAEQQDQQQIGPHTLPTLLGVQNGAAGMTKQAALAHSDAIGDQRSSACAFISACCKTYVLHTGYRSGYATEYGWRLPAAVGWGSKNSSGTGYLIQTAQKAHAYAAFWDYSMGAVFVKKKARINGRTVDLSEVVRYGEASELRMVSPPGAVPYVIHPECPRVADDKPGKNPILKRGDRGPDVARWQRILEEDFYSMAPYGIDSDFGSLTHNATLSWQTERGIPGTGVVDDATWGAVGKALAIRPEPDGDVTSTIIARHWTNADRKTVDLVVFHTIEGKEASTLAENCAKWFAGRVAPQASAHYCIDDDSTVQCVLEEHVAWAAPGCNHNGIQLEHAGFARQTLEEWFDPFSRRMLTRSAKLTAAICTRWGIPPVFVDAAGLNRGDRGITTHYQVSRGPGKGRTNHGDPGKGFPMTTYIEMVQGFM